MSGATDIALCVFTYGNPSRHLLASLMQPLGQSVRLIHYGQSGNADIVTSRNLAVWDAYQTPAEVLVLIDADQSFPPGTIEELVRGAVETRGVCGGLIARKGSGAGLAAECYQGDDQDFEPGEPGLLRLRSVGTGMMAIHRSVIERLLETADRVWYGGQEMPALFDHIYLTEDGRTRRLGEDFSFCHRCRVADVPIHASQQPEIKHWGEHGFTWQDAIKPKPVGDPVATQIAPAGYNVVTVRPTGYRHSDSFREMSTLLASALRDLGRNVQESENAFASAGRNIVLGANLLPRPPAVPYIVYQLEQLADREGWATPAYLEVLRAAEEVWDYAPENIEWLAAKGIEAKLLPIGYHEALETVPPPPAAGKDIDVLFYGSKNERRARLIEQIQSCGLNVVARWADCYGAERDALIARAKVVLVCHFYEAQVMEQLRISHLLNNRALVVAEASDVNPYPPEVLDTAPFEKLPEACHYWVTGVREGMREEMVRKSYDWLRARPMSDYLREVLA